MSLSMKFPGAYFQGKDALEEFAEHTMCYGRSFLFVGSKSALRVSKEKLAHSFSGTDAQIQFELTSGVPCASEVQRVTKLAADSGAQVLCAIGGGGVMDIVRSAAMDLGRAMVMIPTAAASDAPCTFVSVLYSENGQGLVGGLIFPKRSITRRLWGIGSSTSARIWSMSIPPLWPRLRCVCWCPAWETPWRPGTRWRAARAAGMKCPTRQWPCAGSAGS